MEIKIHKCEPSLNYLLETERKILEFLERFEKYPKRKNKLLKKLHAVRVQIKRHKLYLKQNAEI